MHARPTHSSLFSESPIKTTSSGWITAHCDGGARGNPGPAGYGAEITGPDGQVIAELSEYLGHRTNNYAEYSGLLASLQYALDHHHPRLRVISDSELMVKQIQGKYKVNSPDLKPLWQEAKNRIARLEAFEISHALRHKNKAADALANQAMDRGMKRSPAPSAPQPTLSRSKGQAISSPDVGMTPHNPIATPKAHQQPIISRPDSRPAPSSPDPKPAMFRGFTRDGVVHLLGSNTLPDGIFVKVIPE
jgi:probable phosphoglycerate mutase